MKNFKDFLINSNIANNLMTFVCYLPTISIVVILVAFLISLI
jgi:hypothetical protein